MTVTQQAQQATTTRAAAPVPAHPLTFHGSGTANIGTFTVQGDSEITWTNDGMLFQILDPSEGLIVNSQTHAGQSAVSAGTYHHVLVNALGNWTIRIAPG